MTCQRSITSKVPTLFPIPDPILCATAHIYPMTLGGNPFHPWLVGGNLPQQNKVQDKAGQVVFMKFQPF